MLLFRTCRIEKFRLLFGIRSIYSKSFKPFKSPASTSTSTSTSTTDSNEDSGEGSSHSHWADNLDLKHLKGRKGGQSRLKATMEMGKELRELKELKRAEKEKDAEKSTKERLLKDKSYVVDPSEMASKKGLEVLIPDNIEDSEKSLNLLELSARLNWGVQKTAKLVMEIEGLVTPPNQHELLSREVVEFMLMEYGKRDKVCIKPRVDLTKREFSREQLSKLPLRPPVVTIMGHVDHGKTTLLDYFRKSNIAAGEAGGITQHIGAFSVDLKNGARVTFLDTPGHEAFCDMRHRGALITDLVILVVAAPDSVQNQTIESIKFALEAKVPVIVAITKSDLATTGMKDIESELSFHGIVSESYGGETQAIKGLNMGNLEDAISAEAEILELRADDKGMVEGNIIEVKKDLAHGTLATVLIRHGTLRVGDFLAAGKVSCKVRSMRDSNGNFIEEAGPSTPVVISGWNEIPFVGVDVIQADSEDLLNNVIKERIRIEQIKLNELRIKENLKMSILMRDKTSAEFKAHSLRLGRVYLTESEYIHLRLNNRSDYTLEEISFNEANLLRFNLNVDVVGTLEAISQVLSKVPMGKVRIEIVRKSVGPPKIADVELAEVFAGPIICFNCNVSSEVESLAEKSKVPIFNFKVIYHLVAKVQELMLAKLPDVFEEEIVGRAVVKEKFIVKHRMNSSLNNRSASKSVKRDKAVAGCNVIEGKITNPSKAKNSSTYYFRVLRDGKTINENDAMESLKLFKEEVEKIEQGSDCGIMLRSEFADFCPGDIIECLRKVKRVKTIEDLA